MEKNKAGWQEKLIASLMQPPEYVLSKLSNRISKSPLNSLPFKWFIIAHISLSLIGYVFFFLLYPPVTIDGVSNDIWVKYSSILTFLLGAAFILWIYRQIYHGRVGYYQFYIILSFYGLIKWIFDVIINYYFASPILEINLPLYLVANVFNALFGLFTLFYIYNYWHQGHRVQKLQ